jgi:exodeoxyribonuclease VII large subunit
VPVRSDLLADVGVLTARLTRAAGRLVERREADLRGLTRALGDPNRLLEGSAQRLDDWGERLRGAPVRAVDERARWLTMLGARFDAISVVGPINQACEQVRALSDRARRAMDRRLERYEQAAARAGQVLKSLSYRRVLERGYAVARNADGHAIIDAASAAETLAKVEFADGTVAVRVGGRKSAADGKGKSQAQPRLL